MRETASENIGGKSSRGPGAALISYLAKAVLAVGTIAALIQFVDRSGVWMFSLLCLILAVPIFCQRAYFRAIRRMHWLIVFRDGGRVQRLLSGVALRLVSSAVIGLALAFFMAFRLRAMVWQEWLALLAAVPSFWVASYLLRTLADEADPRFRVFVRVRTASWLVLPLLLLIYGLLVVGVSGPSLTEFTPWTDQRDGKQIVSTVVAELDALHEGWRVLESFVLGRISELGEWGWATAVAIFVASNAALFYGCVSIIACLSLPQSELSRAFCRVTTGPDAPRPPLAGVVLASAICTIFACSLYFPVAAKIEATLAEIDPAHRPMQRVRVWAAAANVANRPDPVQLEGHSIPSLREVQEVTPSGNVKPIPPQQPPRLAKIIVERVGGRFYRAGTIKRIREARLDFLSSQSIDLEKLTNEIDRGFNLMEQNIDLFLDWYYSLLGEYARLLKLLTGSFEGFLADKFAEYLSQGAPFGEFERVFSALLESESSRKSQYSELTQRIFGQNEIFPGDPSRLIVAEDIDDADSLLSFRGVVASARIRLVTSGLLGLGGAGAAGTAAVGLKVTGVAGKKVAVGVAQAVTKKLAAKGAFKAAAKVAAKLAVKMAAAKTATGVGAVVGGVVGSIVPVAGTAVGAVAGGAIVGLAFGVGADSLLLELDEALNRGEFRSELVESLNEERQKMLDAITPGMDRK